MRTSNSFYLERRERILPFCGALRQRSSLMNTAAIHCQGGMIGGLGPMTGKSYVLLKPDKISSKTVLLWAVNSNLRHSTSLNGQVVEQRRCKIYEIKALPIISNENLLSEGSHLPKRSPKKKGKISQTKKIKKVL